MVFKENISTEVSLYINILHREQNISIPELVRHFPGICRRTIYRHAQRTIPIWSKPKASKVGGRHPKLGEREGHQILRTVKRLRGKGALCSNRIKLESGILNVSDRTICRCLNKHGYHYLQTRKKGLLSVTDRKIRKRFSRKMEKDFDSNVWTDRICFYLDGSSFVFKNNPCDQAVAPTCRVWRKRNEGLLQGCVAKGRKCGTGGKLVHLMVAISYKKGVIVCEQYEKLNGAYFVSFIERNFANMFRDSGEALSRLWIQDGDPSQNGVMAKKMQTC